MSKLPSLTARKGRTRAGLPLVFTVIFTQAARAELIDAQDWYEREAAGLPAAIRCNGKSAFERSWVPRTDSVTPASQRWLSR